MSGKWELYDRLIAGIPDDLTVGDYAAGCAWTMVEAGGETGVALTVRQRAGPALESVRESAPITGTKLKETAELVKSWNFIEASIGMAAINAWYNRKSRVERLGILPQGGAPPKRDDAFDMFGDSVRGKNVAVIGHFPHIEKQLAPICRLFVLEREPLPGDYPDSACEYILPDQDFVFITGMTLTNKTLPRLLELIRAEAEMCLVGPSVPLADVLFEYGVRHLSAFCAVESAVLQETLKRGAKQEIFKSGYMVYLSRNKKDIDNENKIC